MTKQYKEIVATFNAGDLAFLKSFLDGRGIDYLVEGENFNQVRPLVVPTKIKVEVSQWNDVKELLKDFESGPFGHNI